MSQHAALDVFEVLDGGFLTSVQDAGRPGLEGMGLGPGGAADPWSLGVANALAGNAPGAAALEITLGGPVLRALRPVTVALAGADLGAVTGVGRALPSGQSRTLAAGTILRFEGAVIAATGRAPDRWAPRMRAYLAIPGGFEVPPVLGSRSTALGAGFGGLEGRALRDGDVLASARGDPTTAEALWPGSPVARAQTGDGGIVVLRVLPGPWADLQATEALRALVAQAWQVSQASDRVGLRLSGAPLPGVFPADLASHGLTTGAIQVPPGGQPIVLLPDRQPTGGYAVAAVVITADRSVLGQLAPGDRLRLRPATPDEAVAALRTAGDERERALRHLREDRQWDALTDHAGG